MRSRIVLIAAIMFMLVAGGDALAQSDADEHKFEVGGQFTTIRFESQVINEDPNIVCVRFPCGRLGVEGEFEPGFGGRIGYNFNRHIAAEAEVNLFPDDDVAGGGRKLQGLFGVKAGRRFERFGVFGKARPGFIHAEAGNLRPRGGCIAIFPSPIGCFETDSSTDFTADVGGVFEFYPSSRTIIRFDAGDTILRYGDRFVAVAVNPPPGTLGPIRFGVIRAPEETSHNLQLSVGFGFRF